MKSKIVIFGATGSVGKSTLDVLRVHKEAFEVFALTANTNKHLLLQQCVEFKPTYAWIKNPGLAQELQAELLQLQIPTKILITANDLIYLASHPDIDIVMSAIVGSAGLIPTYYAAISGKRILLANKESLVAGGKIITDAVAANKAQLIPVDSEHSAIFQALPYQYKSLEQAGVNKIILTASGGPFLNTPYEELNTVSAAAAIKHPNWNMGQKISVDSATLMNKGLELIEARWLFNAKPEQLEVVIHPQSIIHSMVEYIDSSVIAQLGTPDMKTPIAYALSAPDRINSGSSRLNFQTLGSLTFASPDTHKFPCLQIALDCLQTSNQSAAPIINAANEIAVAKFLAQRHGFYAIPHMIEKALYKFDQQCADTLEDLLFLDQETRNFCNSL